MRKLITLILVLIIGIVGCSKSSSYPYSYVEVEWVDVVMWNDKTYYFDEEKNRQEKDREIHEEIGVISFSVVGSKEEDNPTYELKNREATFAREGSKIYSLKGLNSDEYIYIGDKIYSSMEE